MNELIPEPIRALHDSYLQAMGFEPEDLPLGMVYQRWWFDAMKEGLTADGVRLVIKERMKFNASSQFKKGLELKYLIRDEESIAIALNEIAVIRARMRIKLMPSGRAEVLTLTGRKATPEETEAKKIGDVQLIKDLRRAAGI